MRRISRTLASPASGSQRIEPTGSPARSRMNPPPFCKSSVTRWLASWWPLELGAILSAQQLRVSSAISAASAGVASRTNNVMQ